MHGIWWNKRWPADRGHFQGQSVSPPWWRRCSLGCGEKLWGQVVWGKSPNHRQVRDLLRAYGNKGVGKWSWAALHDHWILSACSLSCRQLTWLFKLVGLWNNELDFVQRVVKMNKLNPSFLSHHMFYIMYLWSVVHDNQSSHLTTWSTSLTTRPNHPRRHIILLFLFL